MPKVDIDPTDELAIQRYNLIEGYVLFHWKEGGGVTLIREAAADHWTKRKLGKILKGKKTASKAKKR